MKKYEILRENAYIIEPNGNVTVASQVVLNQELQLDELGIFMTMVLMKQKGEELTDINVTNYGPTPLNEMYPIFQGLIDKKFIAEVQ